MSPFWFLIALIIAIALSGCVKVSTCNPTGEYAYQKHFYGGSRFSAAREEIVKVQKMTCDDGSTEYWELK